MTNTLSDFYPQLLTHPEIRELVQTHFGNEAAKILQRMTRDRLGRDHAEEVEDLLTSFILDHGEEVASYQGLGTTSTTSDEAMRYFEAHHPEAHHLMQAQAKELERLLGRDGAASALGQKREPFTIEVLCWSGLYVVTAEEFEEQWFSDKETAIAFAQSNYEAFIRNAKSV